METIMILNQKMNEFYKAWEFERTEEQFITMNAELESTDEMHININKYENMLCEIEKIINDSKNFDILVESWDSIDLKMLEVLYMTFEIEIEAFVDFVKNEDVRNEIKDFLISNKGGEYGK